MESGNSYISCFLMGGLGNQLFQIFTTIAYGIRNSRVIIFPYSEVLTVGIARTTYWSNLLSDLRGLTTESPMAPFKNEDLRTFVTYRENGFPHQEIPVFSDNYRKVSLFGYYQSYKYFHECKKQITDMIYLNEQQKQIRSVFANVLSDDLNKQVHNVSMHFRLGDYKKNPQFHPIMPYEYYAGALQYILENRKSVMSTMRVLYFCEKEDNDTVTEIIKRLSKPFSNISFVKVDDNIADYKQMLIMSCCDDTIIANSSFSWWAAYLNQNNEKIVCYPNVWFGPANPQNTSDLFPEDWKCIAW